MMGRKIGILFGLVLGCLIFPISTAMAQGKSQNLDEIRKQGFAYLRVGNWTSAQQTFENALNLASKDPLSLYGNSLALFNLKRFPEATANLEVAIEILSGTQENNQLWADLLVLSAVISAVQNDNALAVTKLEKAVNLYPNHFDANFSLGRAYFGNGEIDKAVTSFRRTIEIQPNDPRSHFFLATALERAEKTREAMAEYRKVLELNPNNADGHLGLGVLLIKTEGDRSEEGLKALQKAIALNENLYEAQITLGRVLIRLNRAAEAMAPLQKAVQLAPKNPEPHFQLAIAYRKLGKKAEAEAETEIVKKIHESRRPINSPQ